MGFYAIAPSSWARKVPVICTALFLFTAAGFKLASQAGSGHAGVYYAMAAIETATAIALLAWTSRQILLLAMLLLGAFATASLYRAWTNAQCDNGTSTQGIWELATRVHVCWASWNPNVEILSKCLKVYASTTENGLTCTKVIGVSGRLPLKPCGSEG